MNTGAGDATDLAWKLAGTIAGWGGKGLLDGYLTERHQIGVRNVRASGYATDGRVSWRNEYRPWIADQTPQGAETRAKMARVADIEQRKTNEMLGIELGYRYIETTLIAHEDGAGPDPDNVHYVPTTWPGARLPHAWLDDGSAVHDRLGQWYSLLRLGGTNADTRPLESALRDRGAPLEVFNLPDPAVRKAYGYDLLLVRPDLHVVWRGNEAPPNALELAALATGHA
jgi:hypothetical protein